MSQLLTDLYDEDRLNYLRGYYEMNATDNTLPLEQRRTPALYWAVLELACMFDADTTLALTWGQIDTPPGHITFNSFRVQWDVRTQNFRKIGTETEHFLMTGWSRDALKTYSELSHFSSRRDAPLFTLVQVKDAFRSFEFRWAARGNMSDDLIEALVKRANKEGYRVDMIAAKLNIDHSRVNNILRNEPVPPPGYTPGKQRHIFAEHLKGIIREQYERKVDPSIIALHLGRPYDEVMRYIREIERERGEQWYGGRRFYSDRT